MITIVLMNILIALAVDVRDADLEHKWTEHIIQNFQYDTQWCMGLVNNVCSQKNIQIIWDNSTIWTWRNLCTGSSGVNYRRALFDLPEPNSDGYIVLAASNLDLKDRLQSFKEIERRKELYMSEIQNKNNETMDIKERFDDVKKEVCLSKNDVHNEFQGFKRESHIFMVEVKSSVKEVKEVQQDIKKEVTEIRSEFQDIKVELQNLKELMIKLSEKTST